MRADPQAPTQRELAVLAALVDHPGVEAVALSLGIKPQTVKNHLSIVRSKLNARTTIQAYAIAVRRGLIRLPD
jgi:two-component system NarL family response regulator